MLLCRDRAGTVQGPCRECAGADRAGSVHQVFIVQCAGTVQGPCMECSFVVAWTVHRLSGAKRPTRVYKYELFIETSDGYCPRFDNDKYFNVLVARKIHYTFQGNVFCNVSTQLNSHNVDP